MKFNKDWTKKRWVGYTIAACSAVVLYFLLSHLHIIGRCIAGILGIGEGSARTRLYRARAALLKLMKEEGLL